MLTATSMDHLGMEWIVSSTAIATCLALAGIVTSLPLKRRASLRYCFLFGALMGALISPLASGFFLLSQTSLFVASLPSTASEKERLPSATSLETIPLNEVVTPEGIFVNHASRVSLSENRPISSFKADSSREAFAILTIWWGGILILVFGLGRGWWKILRIRRAASLVHSGERREMLAIACKATGIRSLPNLFMTKEVTIPFVMGIFKPAIILPEKLLEELSSTELQDVLIHECAHLARRDPLATLLQTFAQSALWPILPIHWLGRQITATREEICDNFVLINRPAVDYGETLLRVALFAQDRKLALFLNSILGWQGSLERRIKSLVHERRNVSTRTNKYLATAISCLLLVTAIGLTGTRLTAQERESTLSLTPMEMKDPSSPPVTIDEKAVKRLVLVFFRDQARRAVSGILVKAGDETFLMTTSTACVVPDGMPPAIDRTYLEISETKLAPSEYILSTPEVFVYRVKNVESDFQIQGQISVKAGVSLSVAKPNFSGSNGEVRIFPEFVRVKEVNCRVSISHPTKSKRDYEGLFEIDQILPEGTPLFLNGDLAGLVVLGSRFSKPEAKVSYVLPAQKFDEVLKSLAKHKK